MENQNVINALNHLVSILGHAASKYGPEAVNLSIQYIHYNAIITLVGTSLLLPPAALLMGLSKSFFKKEISILKDDPIYDTRDVYFIIGTFLGILSVILFLIGFSNLMSSSMWLGIFAPKLALVRMAFHSAGVH